MLTRTLLFVSVKDDLNEGREVRVVCQIFISAAVDPLRQATGATKDSFHTVVVKFIIGGGVTKFVQFVHYKQRPDFL